MRVDRGEDPAATVSQEILFVPVRKVGADRVLESRESAEEIDLIDFRLKLLIDFIQIYLLSYDGRILEPDINIYYHFFAAA